MRFPLTGQVTTLPSVLLAVALAFATLLVPAQWAAAADHGDAPAIANDRAADIGDCFFFLDPNDNTKVVMEMTVQGFIVPQEALNFALFDHRLRYRFELETTGDAEPDEFIEVSFSEKTGNTGNPQTATIASTFFASFTGPTTPAAEPVANPPQVTTDPRTGIAFFAGIVDDPFFFDIPAFVEFRKSAMAGQPDPTQFQRGRDSFAGYDTLAIALSIPVNQLRLTAGNNVVGLLGRTWRPPRSKSAKVRKIKKNTKKFNVDRMGVPAVNVALIPFGRKNEYNLASPRDDAAGKFARDILGTLGIFRTNAANMDILAQTAVTHGDFLRLDLTKPNTGPGGGNNTAAAFPNGRRLGDDTIDILLFFINNQAPLGDNVDGNDVPLRDTFPFFALPHEPFPAGTIDDRTRN